jgi:hypothetical protein
MVGASQNSDHPKEEKESLNMSQGSGQSTRRHYQTSVVGGHFNPKTYQATQELVTAHLESMAENQQHLRDLFEDEDIEKAVNFWKQICRPQIHVTNRIINDFQYLEKLKNQTEMSQESSGSSQRRNRPEPRRVAASA